MKRLLIDAEVIRTLEALPESLRRQLWRRMEEIGAQLERFADFQEKTPGGRDVDIHVCGRFAILFWNDHADRHVKILGLGLADR